MSFDFKKYGAEAMGTAILVFIACGVAVFANGIFANPVTGDLVTGGVNVVATALAFGLVIVAMAYTIGPISGCHINPAVSLGALIDKRIKPLEFLFYLAAQVIGAIFGGLLLFAIVKIIGLDAAGNMGANGYVIAETKGRAIVASFIVEIVLTFIFVLTILAVTSKKEYQKKAGIIIGLTLTLVHLIGIRLTGTSVNPARSLGVAIFGGVDALREVWVFLIAPFIGAIAAGFTWKCLFGKKKEEDFNADVSAEVPAE